MLSHYYRNYIYKIYVELDEEDFLHIDQIVDTKVVRQAKTPVSFPLQYYVDRLSADDEKSAIEIKSIRINGLSEDLSRIEIENTDTIIKKRIELKLEQAESDLTYHINLVYSIKDCEFTLFCERFIDYLRVEVIHTPKLRVLFSPMGRERFDDLETSPTGFVKVFRSIVLPEKGFRLIFTKN